MLYILSINKSKQQTERSSLKKFLKAGGGSGQGIAPLPQACPEQYTILFKPFPQADTIRYRIA